MKYIISLFVMLTLSMSSFAEVKREGNIFKVEQTSKARDTKTKYTWEDKKETSILSSLQREVHVM